MAVRSASAAEPLFLARICRISPTPDSVRRQCGASSKTPNKPALSHNSRSVLLQQFPQWLPRRITVVVIKYASFARKLGLAKVIAW